MHSSVVFSHNGVWTFSNFPSKVWPEASRMLKIAYREPVARKNLIQTEIRDATTESDPPDMRRPNCSFQERASDLGGSSISIFAFSSTFGIFSASPPSTYIFA